MHITGPPASTPDLTNVNTGVSSQFSGLAGGCTQWHDHPRAHPYQPTVCHCRRERPRHRDCFLVASVLGAVVGVTASTRTRVTGTAGSIEDLSRSSLCIAGHPKTCGSSSTRTASQPTLLTAGVLVKRGGDRGQAAAAPQDARRVVGQDQGHERQSPRPARRPTCHAPATGRGRRWRTRARPGAGAGAGRPRAEALVLALLLGLDLSGAGFGSSVAGLG